MVTALFKKEYDICVENFHTLKELKGLVCDIPQMLALLEQHWMYAPDEVIHIGDSRKSDVQGAQSAGIRPILLDREGKHTLQGVTTIRSLKEVFAGLS